MKTGDISSHDGRPRRLTAWPVFSSRQGSIIIYALVILAVCTLVLAGWVNVMSGVAEYSEATRDGITRRLNVENSRNMAVQYLRESVLTGTSTVGLTNTSISWSVSGTSYFIGGVTIPTFSGTSNVLVTTNQPVRWSPFSPAGTSWGTTYFSGFSANVTNAVLHDGTGTTSWSIQARSRTPIFAYDLVVLPRFTSTAGLAINEPSNTAISISEGSFTTSGMLNVALPPDRPPTLQIPTYGATTTIGSSLVTVTSFTSTQTNGSDAVASNRATRLWTGSSGVAVIYPYRDSAPSNPSAKVFNITGSNTSQILISPDSGTSSVAITNPSTAPPILIQCTATNNPLTVNIFRGNVRPIFLRINNTGSCTLIVSSATTPPGATTNTRLSALFTGTHRLLIRSASGTITGGLYTRTGSLRLRNENDSSDQTLNIVRDVATLQTSGQLLEFMPNRNGWVEIYQND